MTGIAEQLYGDIIGMGNAPHTRLLCTGAFLVQEKWNWEEEHEKHVL